MQETSDAAYERRRVSFGGVAELYERARPGYPEQLFDAIAARVPPPAGILEIGCGPGKATIPLARRGYRILALEPAPEMAEIARRNLAGFPAVRVEVSRVEDWPLKAASFELVTAAQAFHWVDPPTGYPKLAQALGQSGLLAAFWNLTESFEGDFLAWAEELFASRRIPFGPDPTAGELDNPDSDIPPVLHGYFDPAGLQVFRWSIEYTTAEYIDLQRTHSHYAVLSNDQTEAVLDSLRTLIESRYAGRIVRHVGTLLRWLKPRA